MRTECREELFHRTLHCIYTSSGWFDCAEPSPTTSLQGIQGAICTSWMRFKHIEPHRTQSNLPCRPAYPFITVVRGGSVWSNRPELTRTCPVGLLPFPLITVVRGGSVLSNCSELTRTCPVGLLPPSSQ